MAGPIIHTLGLCSGIGMLEEAVRLGCEYFGRRAIPACLCEWEAYAATVLLARMEDAALESCPVWCGDLRDFDAKPFRGVVDILAAGLPCPAFSVAGAQRGLDDERAWGSDDSPIPQFLRIVEECRPTLVFIENVPPFVRGGHFRPVGERLSELGYEIELPIFVTAKAVGASHQRERVFILAHALWLLEREWTGRERVLDDGSVVAQPALGGLGELREPPRCDGLTDGSDEPVGDAGSQRACESRRPSREQPEQQQGRAAKPRRRRAVVGNTDGGRRRQQGYAGNEDGASSASGILADAERQRPQGERLADSQRRRELEPCDGNGGVHAFQIFAPGPGADWQTIPAHLWPAVEPGFRELATGQSLVVDASRADQLRCCGNQVVAVQAAVAFVELARNLRFFQ